MLTIHHLGQSQSERIIWLCEELQLPYELIRYEREASRAAPAAYKALHPAGTAPVITDGDLTLSETGAIIEYIARRYAGGRLLLGPEHPEFADFLFWFHYANGSMLPALVRDLLGPKVSADGADGPGPPRSRADIAGDLVEQRLAAAHWIAGRDFTAADIMMVYPLIVLRRMFGRDSSNAPNMMAYLERIAERPAYLTAMAKAEPQSA